MSTIHDRIRCVHVGDRIVIHERRVRVGDRIVIHERHCRICRSLVSWMSVSCVDALLH